MNEKKRISVIIPCYNAEKYIKRCLESVFCQKECKAEIEVICIDDASNDNTMLYLEQFEEKYPAHMVLIPLNENRKQGYARNIGMQYATGDYFFFLDSDDYIDCRFLGKLYQETERNDCDMVVGDFQKVREGMVPDSASYGEVYVVSGMDTFEKRKYILEKGGSTGPCGKLYKRDFINDNSLFFYTGCFMEDIFFSELCMLCASVIVCMSGKGYYYMIHDDSVMFSDGIVKYYMDTPKVQNAVTIEVIKRGLIKGVRNEFMVLHFVKAFVEPVGRMRIDERFFSYPNIRKLKRDLLDLFPDFLDNQYIYTDPETKFYINIIENEYDKETMKNIMYGENIDM